MIRREDRRLRVGVLGCGPIAQFAHLESLREGRECRPLRDLRRGTRSARTHGRDLRTAEDAMPIMTRCWPIRQLEAVIIATSDAFHVPAAIKALDSRQACAVREADRRQRSRRWRSSTTAVERARQSAAGRPHEALRPGAGGRPGVHPTTDMGEMLALKAWYCDSTHRYR